VYQNPPKNGVSQKTANPKIRVSTQRKSSQGIGPPGKMDAHTTGLVREVGGEHEKEKKSKMSSGSGEKKKLILLFEKR